MTNKKPAIHKLTPASQFTKLDTATLRNLARQSELSVDAPHVAVLQTVAEMLMKLSPSNMHLVENIIRCILEEQENKTP